MERSAFNQIRNRFATKCTFAKSSRAQGWIPQIIVDMGTHYEMEVSGNTIKSKWSQPLDEMARRLGASSIMYK
jgi:hypothetical protein